LAQSFHVKAPMELTTVSLYLRALGVHRLAVSIFQPTELSQAPDAGKMLASTELSPTGTDMKPYDASFETQPLLLPHKTYWIVLEHLEGFGYLQIRDFEDFWSTPLLPDTEERYKDLGIWIPTSRGDGIAFDVNGCQTTAPTLDSNSAL